MWRRHDNAPARRRLRTLIDNLPLCSQERQRGDSDLLSSSSPWCAAAAATAPEYHDGLRAVEVEVSGVRAMTLDAPQALGEAPHGELRVVPFPPPLDFGAYVIGVDVESVNWEAREVQADHDNPHFIAQTFD